MTVIITALTLNYRHPYPLSSELLFSILNSRSGHCYLISVIQGHAFFDGLVTLSPEVPEGDLLSSAPVST